MTVNSGGTIEINNVAMTNGTILLNDGATLRGLGAGAGFSGLNQVIAIAPGATAVGRMAVGFWCRLRRALEPSIYNGDIWRGVLR